MEISKVRKELDNVISGLKDKLNDGTPKSANLVLKYSSEVTETDNHVPERKLDHQIKSDTLGRINKLDKYDKFGIVDNYNAFEDIENFGKLNTSDLNNNSTYDYHYDSFRREEYRSLTPTFSRKSDEHSRPRSYSTLPKEKRTRFDYSNECNDIENSIRNTMETRTSKIQEYYKHRDSQHGKPLSGENSFMSESWPYGLDYSQQKRIEPDPQDKSRLFYRSRSRSMSPLRPINEPLFKKVKVPLCGEDDEDERKRREELRKKYSDVDEKRAALEDKLPITLNTDNGLISLICVGSRLLEGHPVNRPPCNLCHKKITEKRCLLANEGQFHCWHFICAFCYKILKAETFHIGVNHRPYCNRICYERTYPKKSNFKSL